MRVVRSLLPVLLLAILVTSIDAARPPVAEQAPGQQTPARRASTGDAVTDSLASLSWRSIGPANMGGRVTAMGTPEQVVHYAQQVARKSADHSARRTWTDDSNRSKRSGIGGIGMPIGMCSPSCQPAPMPTTNRPRVA